jgi:hypothetical protein
MATQSDNKFALKTIDWNNWNEMDSECRKSEKVEG